MANDAGERFSLKDHLFNHETVSYLGGLLSDADPGFDREAFADEVLARMPPLELKQRIAMITEVLERHMPAGFPEAAALISRALPPPLDPSKTDDDFGDFIFAPFGEFVAANGLAEEHYEVSIGLIKELTMRFSMEGPIRPFLETYPDETMQVLAQWAEDSNYHVRRLVSEGTRHRLPWAPRISLAVDAPLPLLDLLYADSTRYVTRSVANHMNDIAKSDPELVVATLDRWQRSGRQEDAEMQWIMRHALRSLIKQGHPGAMELLGYSTNPDVTVIAFRIRPEGDVVIGREVVLELDLEANSAEDLIVDYAVSFVRKKGASTKVFKLKQLSLEAGAAVTVRKTHKLKADATTFTLLPGRHTVTVQLNGRPVADGEFNLIEAAS